MVSLLIVSHSALLAAGVKEFIDQATAERVLVATAGGNIDGSLGTNADLIAQQLEEINSTDGTLVLVDFGSAVMSVELAIEMHGFTRVLVSDAPLVEGAYLAALEAAAGSSLEQAAAAALQARELIKVHR